MSNQKPERRRPFGTGLVRHCPQGLFSPFFTFLRAIFFLPFSLSLAPTIRPWVSEDAHRYVFFNFQLNMSVVYRVVQFSFLNARFVAIPFLDTGTKFAYTIMKVVLINHISKVKVSPHVRPHFPTMVTASLTRMHEVQRLISTGLRDIHNWIRDERII